jgi:hypothetical protein
MNVMNAATKLAHRSLKRAEPEPSPAPLEGGTDGVEAASISSAESNQGVRKAARARPDRSVQIEAVEAAFKDGKLSKEVYEMAQEDLLRLEAQEKAREESVSCVQTI